MSILEKLKPRVNAMKESPIYKRMKEDAKKSKPEILQITCSKELAHDGLSKAKCGGCNKHMYERLMKQLERLRKARADADAENNRRQKENNPSQNGANADAENNGIVETNEFPDEDYTFPANSLGVNDPEETLPADNTLLLTVIFKHLQEFNNMVEYYDKIYYHPDVEAAATQYDKTKSDMALEQMWSFHFFHTWGKMTFGLRVCKLSLWLDFATMLLRNCLGARHHQRPKTIRKRELQEAPAKGAGQQCYRKKKGSLN
jgi:hypothetical protein